VAVILPEYEAGAKEKIFYLLCAIASLKMFLLKLPEEFSIP
jgi:hypothetical protein